MDSEKIGLFIKFLREKNHYSQVTLADKLHISRQAISKWERGITIPNPDILLELSTIFNVSINEILIGKEKSKINETELNNITTKMLNDINKKQAIIKKVFIILISVIFFFLIYYFFNSYNHFKVYMVTGKENKTPLVEGVLFKAYDKCYLKLATLNNNLEILGFKLYYQKNKEKITLYELENIKKEYTIQTLIFNLKDKNFKLDKNYSNLYLDIKTTKDNKTLKLEFKKDYANRYNIGTTLKPIEDTSTSLNNNLDFKLLIERLESKLLVSENSNLIYNSSKVTLNYLKNINILKVTIIDNDLKLNYTIDLEKKVILYEKFKDNQPLKMLIYQNNTCSNEDDCKEANNALNKELEAILNEK